MAQTSWPSIAGSRIVTDSQYEQIASGWAADGIMQGPAATSVVYGDSTGLQVKIRADKRGMVRGHGWLGSNTVETVAISANSSGSTRYDLIVLRLTRSTMEVATAVVEGVPGSGVPAVTQDAGTSGVWETPLAVVTVASGATTIAAGDVADVAPLLTNGSTPAYRSLTALGYAFAAPTQGMSGFVLDENRMVAHDSTAFAPVGRYRMASSRWDTLTTGVTETLVPESELTITATAGRRLEFHLNGMMYSTVGADTMYVRVYYEAGTSVTTGGTWAWGIELTAPGNNVVVPLHGYDEAAMELSGPVTFGAFIGRWAGSGTIGFGNTVGGNCCFSIHDIGSW